MNFVEAVKIADANQHLIGKVWNGATIEDVVVAPTDTLQWSEFERSYISSLNAQEAIIPFMNSDVEVFVVCDRSRIRTQSLFVYSSIRNLPENFNVVFNVS
ncbi:MAG: hypothetical protein K6F40_02775 [Bacteroidales bacterium]|nr:hypothetical protein [Bacteroidales bacterium]